MIASLRGKLAEKSPGEVVVDVGGVGYHAYVPLSTFCRLPEEGASVELLTVTNLRENALELFAFSERRERALFRLLRGVSGIGPRLALAILSGIESEELAAVLEAGAAERLVAIPGVGRKTAERVGRELKGKLEGPLTGAGDDGNSAELDAVRALGGCGYKERDSREAGRASREGGAAECESLIEPPPATRG